jgi:hypothetical protein
MFSCEWMRLYDISNQIETTDPAPLVTLPTVLDACSASLPLPSVGTQLNDFR